MTATGIGARVLRKEDHRHLHGRGNFVSDIVMPRMKEVAFLRSPVAHAKLRGVTKPPEREGSVFTAADLVGLRPMRAVSTLPGYRSSDYPVLADGKVRFVGEPIAMCVADSRAVAEDIAQQVEFEVEEIAAVVDMIDGKQANATLVHEQWGTNVLFETARDDDIGAVAATAAHCVKRTFRMSRQAMVPMEGKGVLAYWDERRDQLVVITSTQIPHLVRNGISEMLGLEQRRVRVVAPDVGGGFGFKCMVHPEELAVCWLAMQTKLPIRYIEDRREHLVATANAREHHYEIAAFTDARGKILALDADVTVDAGAYSIYPFSACLEASMLTGTLPGPYAIDCYRIRTQTVATNKPPIVPYRGVARPGACFAIELTIDAIAREIGREPIEVRMENLVPPSAMPYRNITNKIFDSGDYPESLRRAIKLIDLDAVRTQQQGTQPDGRLIGVGFAIYTEQAAHGTSVFAGWGIPAYPGYEQATVKLTPDGGLEIRVGVQSHGQGMETTLAQIASELLGIDPARISVIHGDTDLTPYSAGTYASRSIVMAGGAVVRACRVLAERAKIIGGHLLQDSPAALRVEGGRVVSERGSVDLSEVAGLWYLRAAELPKNVDLGGLEVTMGYLPSPDTGTFTYSTHAVTVALDPDLGTVELLDYVVVHDCGTVVNPLVVDGQVYGGTAQGIGTALYEETPYDSCGQPLASTFMDYILPGAPEIPHIRLDHTSTPSPNTEYGIKGMGEGPAIAPAAAIANAVNDALRGIGAEVFITPITPRRVMAAIAAARPKAPAGPAR